eukprot:gene13849-biopygen14252
MSAYSVASVAAGWECTVFITSSGEAYATGGNSFGQLGDGTTTSRSTPVHVMSAYTVSSAAIGSTNNGRSHTIFVTSDGKAYATGSNACGQLGDGTTTWYRSTPVQVMSAYTISSAAAGGYSYGVFGYTIFITTDGEAYAVGENSAGQLGDGTFAWRSTPVQVMSAYTISSAAAGQSHTMFLTSDGEAYGAGSNFYGEFGDGTTTSKSTP